MPETMNRSVGCLLQEATKSPIVLDISSSASESDICINRPERSSLMYIHPERSSLMCNHSERSSVMYNHPERSSLMHSHSERSSLIYKTLNDDYILTGHSKKWGSMTTHQFIRYTSMTRGIDDKLHSNPNIQTDILPGLLSEADSEWIKEKHELISGPSKRDVTISLTSVERPMKNLLVLSIGWMFFFMAFFSIRALQSSLNHAAGLGLASLACIYAGFLVACAFTTAIVQNLGTKWTLVASLVCHIVYVGANIYPSFYIIIPSSLVAGFSQAAMWTAQGSYLIRLSRADSVIQSKSLKITASKYFGIFFLFYSISPVFGSILTSLIMSQERNWSTNVLHDINRNTSLHGIYNGYREGKNDTTQVLGLYSVNQSDVFIDVGPTCGSKFCHDQSEQGTSFTVTMEMRFILMGSYIICMVVALLVFALFLETNKSSSPRERQRQKLLSQFSAILDLLKNPKFHLLAPLIFFVGIQTAFYSGEITKAYVSCLYGVKMVGYSMACFGVSAALASYLSGRLQRYVSRLFILCLGALVNGGCLLTMVIWQPSEGSLAGVLCLVGLWGVGDGVWMTHVNCETGLLFADNTEAAYSAYQLTIAVGLVVGYAYSQYICMLVKIYITAVFSVFGISGFALLKWYLKKQRQIR